MDAPTRPRSSEGLDGVNLVVSAPTNGVVQLHLRADEIATARAAALDVRQPVTAQAATVSAVATPMEVSAAPASEPGFLDGLVGAVLGFLFG
jgi:hypothetical protein